MPIGRRKDEDCRYFGAKSKRRNFASFGDFVFSSQNNEKTEVYRYFVAKSKRRNYAFFFISSFRQKCSQISHLYVWR